MMKIFIEDEWGGTFLLVTGLKIWFLRVCCGEKNLKYLLFNFMYV